MLKILIQVINSNEFDHCFLYVILIYLLTAIGLTTSCSSTVHIYTQTVNCTTQLKTLVGRLSWIRTRSGENNINDILTA
jgi:uncharacterized integral membrane protein